MRWGSRSGYALKTTRIQVSESIFKEGQSSQEMLQAVLEKAIGLSKEPLIYSTKPGHSVSPRRLR